MAEELGLPWCFEDEHLAWQKTVAEFCSRVVAPDVVARDLAGQLDPDLIREVGRLGAFGLRVPEAYGGSAADLRSMCIAAEEFSVLDSSLAVTVHVQAISAALFHHLADEDLRAEFLPGMASGETFCAFGLTEPTGGSDAGNIGTRAVRNGLRLGHQRGQAVHHQLRHPVLQIRDPFRRPRGRGPIRRRARHRSPPSLCRSTLPA